MTEFENALPFRVQCYVTNGYGLLYGPFLSAEKVHTPTMKITQKTLAELPEGIHLIEENFYIRVRGNKRYFFFAYRKDGRRKEIGLGGIKRTSFALAREKATKLRLDLMSGKEPCLEEKPVASGRTFNEIYKEAIATTDDVKRWKNEKHRRQWYSSIETYALTLQEAQRYVAYGVASGTMGHLATVFGMLTALRANEFIRARWEEIDLDNALWIVPPERRKIARDFPMRVPLSEQACAVLKHLAQTLKGKPVGYVFYSETAASGHISLETPRIMLRKVLKRSVTMHGCRSTFRDWAEETGQNPTATERCLMHEEPNKTTRAYQRSDLLEKRRPLMQAWADAIFPKVLIKLIQEPT